MCERYADETDMADSRGQIGFALLIAEDPDDENRLAARRFKVSGFLLEAQSQ